MPRLFSAARLALAALASAPAAAQTGAIPVGIGIAPDPPHVVRHAESQALNFDFRIVNQSPETLTVVRIDLSVFDSAGQRVLRRFLWSEGAMKPGLLTVPERVVPPGATLGLFNPFPNFEPGLPLDRLEFTFRLQAASGREVELPVVVRPTSYRNRTALQLPLRGRVLDYDGYDYYSHHRRIDITHPALAAMGLRMNPVLYATDFCPVDSAGELYHGARIVPANWVGYGAPVYAAAAGTVISAAGDVPDNRIEKGELVAPDPSGMDERRRSLGNHVILDHGNGEFTRYAHLAPGSVRVLVGDRVDAGARLGQIGFSGDSGFHVHLHFDLLLGVSLDAAQPVPPLFTGFRRLRGGMPVWVERGAIDTGEIVEGR